jgi:hypothetical protein
MKTMAYNYIGNDITGSEMKQTMKITGGNQHSKKQTSVSHFYFVVGMQVH